MSILKGDLGLENSLKVKANNRKYISKGIQTKIDYHWYGKNTFNDLEFGLESTTMKKIGFNGRIHTI